MKKLRIVFAGNPNCGKTTLFNALAGTNLKTANYPGVTVEKRSACFQYKNTLLELYDLPGIYDLQQASAEEEITRQTLLEKDYDVIVNVLDATNLSLGLYLTQFLFTLEKPVVLAVNMMDLVQARGMQIDIDQLQHLFSAAVIGISARKKTGFTALCDAMLQPRTPTAVCKITNVQHWIDGILSQCVKTSRVHSHTDALDRLLLHPVLGYAFFACVMGLIFFLTFRLGDGCKAYMQQGLSFLCLRLEALLFKWNISPAVRSLLLDGVISGAASILSFLPNLLILYVLLALLQDSGYMARIVYLTDETMHRLSLSGKSSIALILALGCSVPAICATQTIEDHSSRIRTMLCVPFVSCSARLPIYVLFAGTFFPEHAALAVFLLYLLGIGAALLWALILSPKKQNKTGSRLLIELPDYRTPDFYSVCMDVWMKLRDYLTRAATIVVASSVLLWILTHVGMDGYTRDIASSFAARIGTLLAKPLQYAGLGFWQIAVALIAGLWAKEVVVAYTYILFSLPQSASAASLCMLLKGIGFGKSTLHACCCFVCFIHPVWQLWLQYGGKADHCAVFLQI